MCVAFPFKNDIVLVRSFLLQNIWTALPCQYINCFICNLLTLHISAMYCQNMDILWKCLKLCLFNRLIFFSNIMILLLCLTLYHLYFIWLIEFVHVQVIVFYLFLFFIYNMKASAVSKSQFLQLIVQTWIFYQNVLNFNYNNFNYIIMLLLCLTLHHLYFDFGLLNFYIHAIVFLFVF